MYILASSKKLFLFSSYVSLLDDDEFMLNDEDDHTRTRVHVHAYMENAYMENAYMENAYMENDFAFFISIYFIIVIINMIRDNQFI